MDEKLKTQTFRFTNQFKVEGIEDDDSIDAEALNVHLEVSDEESIAEEIETSHHTIKQQNPTRRVEEESAEILKKIQNKPPLFPILKQSNDQIIKIDTMTGFKENDGTFKNLKDYVDQQKDKPLR